jgi:hypothetical protein
MIARARGWLLRLSRDRYEWVDLYVQVGEASTPHSFHNDMRWSGHQTVSTPFSTSAAISRRITSKGGVGETDAPPSLL